MPAIGASERMSHTSSLAEVHSFFGDCLWGGGEQFTKEKQPNILHEFSECVRYLSGCG